MRSWVHFEKVMVSLLHPRALLQSHPLYYYTLDFEKMTKVPEYSLLSMFHPRPLEIIFPANRLRSETMVEKILIACWSNCSKWECYFTAYSVHIQQLPRNTRRTCDVQMKIHLTAKLAWRRYKA